MALLGVLFFMNTTTSKISQNRLKKEKVVAELSAKIAKSKAIVFTNYQGLTHQQIESLKKELRRNDAEFEITKNTLLKIALSQNNLASDDETFEYPTATLFAYGNIVSPLKELAKKIKELQLPVIKMGLIDGKVTIASDIQKLATLPSRNTLITQLVITLNYPIYGLHRSLNWNFQRLV